MFRPGFRLVQRSLPTSTRRFVHTTPVRARSWKSSAVRWGAAIGTVYYYNTSDLFAEEPAHLHITPDVDSNPESLPTIDSLTKSRRQHALNTPPQAPTTSSVTTDISGDVQNDAPSADVEDLEQEADQQGAFNPETGEINWDCPCLGGMAHGPCGEQFKAAFSCFVFSKEDPKGMDCIDKFKGMQDCFREHPDIYGEEFDNEENEEGIDVAVASNDASHSTEVLEVQDTDKATGQSTHLNSTQELPSEDLQTVQSQHKQKTDHLTPHDLSKDLVSDGLDNAASQQKQESSPEFVSPPRIKQDSASSSVKTNAP